MQKYKVDRDEFGYHVIAEVPEGASTMKHGPYKTKEEADEKVKKLETENDVIIILPEQKMGLLGALLVELTERISKIDPDLPAHGALGGQYGYGAVFENDVFMMHPYCWCEKEECRWCSDDAPNFLHKPSGLTVSWYKYIGRGMEAQGTTDLMDAFVECFTSLKKQGDSDAQA